MKTTVLERSSSILQDISSNEIKNIFFCGIGGIGMSGLAVMSKKLNYNVCGSNNIENDNTIRLRNEHSVDILIGHNASNLDNKYDLFVYTSSINENNIEFIKAKELGLTMVSRGDFLAYLMRQYYNIVVAGSHGKTTTTAMIFHVLSESNFDPNVIIGGLLNQYSSNVKFGNSNYLAVESDESDGSFIKMPVNIGVITNIDQEHLDYYKDFNSLVEYFRSFIEKAIAANGLIIYSGNETCNQLIQDLNLINYSNVITYDIENANTTISATNIRNNKDGSLFDVIDNRVSQVILKDFKIRNMFGSHNILNALAAIGVGLLNHVPYEILSSTLANFDGVKKRFTQLGKINNFYVVDDYAHNSAKIKAAIDGARSYIMSNDSLFNDTKKLIVVFEPHRYSRMKNSIDTLADSFCQCDQVLLLDIYSASEEPIKEINQDIIFDAISVKHKNVVKVQDNDLALNRVISNIINNKNESGIIMFCGAGNSSNLAKSILKNLNLKAY